MTRQANALLVIIVAFLLAYLTRFGYTSLPNYYLVALLTTIAICAIVLPATGAFRKEFEWAVLRRLRRLIAGWAIVVLLLVSVSAMLKITDDYSRIWFGLWVIYSTVGLVIVLLLSHYASIRRRRNRTGRRIAVIGSGDAARRLEQQIHDDPFSDIQIAERFGSTWGDHPALPIGDTAEKIRDSGLKEVWIAIDWEDQELLAEALSALKDSVVDVNVIPDFHQYRLLNQNISEWGGLPVINLSATPMTGAEMRLKSVMDRLGALVLTVLLSPVLILITLAIWITDGRPAIFRQKRLGVGGDAIEILKFRTMRAEESDKAFRQATADDDRVTGLGKFLRRTSLDELPQIINVLKGEMSLVGPRPHPIALNDEFKARIPRYMLRHKVQPGITGWAQVNGFRGQTETPEKMALRIEHDLWYIQNWSLWLDLKILLMTPFVMFHRNAY